MEKVDAGGVDEMTECPWCDHGYIYDDEDDRVKKCEHCKGTGTGKNN
jgi:hypothetical protein